MNYIVIPGLPINGRQYKYDMIVEAVCAEFRVTVDQLKHRSRKRPVVEARQALCYTLRYKLGYGIVRIGDIINRDHTTVIHSCRTMQNLIETDQHMRSRIHNINQRLF